MSDKAIRNAIMTARKFARRKFADGGQPVKIDPVTGLPIPQDGGGGADGSSASPAPSTSDNSTSPTGFGPIDNAIANPGQTATNIGAGIALGALGPIGMGISAANTVSGLLGGPTIGSTLVGPSEPSTPTNVGTVASYSNSPTSTTTSSTPSSSTSHAGMSDQLGADIQDTNAASAALMGDIQAGLNSSTTNSSSTPTSTVSDALGATNSGAFGLSGPTGSSNIGSFGFPSNGPLETNDVSQNDASLGAMQGPGAPVASASTNFGSYGNHGDPTMGATDRGNPLSMAQAFDQNTALATIANALSDPNIAASPNYSSVIGSSLPGGYGDLASSFGPDSTEASALAAAQAGINSASLAESPSSAPPDGTTPDGTPPDGATPGGGTPDGGTPDGGTPDGGTPDGGSPDGGSPGGDDDGHTGGRFTNPNRRPKEFRVKHNWNKHIEMMSQDDLKKEIRKAFMTAKRRT